MVIGCAHPGCDKKYDAPDGLSKHIKLNHNGKLIPEGIKQEEAEVIFTCPFIVSRSNSDSETVADLDIGFGGKLALAHAIGNLPYSSLVTKAKASLI